MRTWEEIDADIAQVREELQTVHGSMTEVYARIVGYYRSVRNWNNGKKEEFSERKMFAHENPKTHTYAERLAVFNAGSSEVREPAFFTLYTRNGCPRCPSVKEYCESLGIAAQYIDVDSAEGMQEAVKHGIRSCPTVIMYDESENELLRAYSIAELKANHVVPCAVEAVIA